MNNLRFSPVFTYSHYEKKLRLFRIAWERGIPGDGEGYSNGWSISLIWKWPGFFAMHTPHNWRVTILGLSIHYLKSYGGRFP